MYTNYCAISYLLIRYSKVFNKVKLRLLAPLSTSINLSNAVYTRVCCYNKVMTTTKTTNYNRDTYENVSVPHIFCSQKKCNSIINLKCMLVAQRHAKSVVH